MPSPPHEPGPRLAATDCRLWIDPPTSGAWNMAVDEVLLHEASTRGRCTLRFYRWNEPTLSLGYFQAFAERAAHRPSLPCPVVRRSTGGGAILHDREVTYCLAVPVAHTLGDDSTWLYDAVHQALLEALYQFGLHARCCQVSSRPSTEPQPFLCFQRRATGDVLLEGEKICGSAQRRSRGAIVQHGSLLLGRSDFAPELPGVADISGLALPEPRLIEAWTQAIGRRLPLRFVDEPPAAETLDEVRGMTMEKFSSERWLRRR